MTISVSLTQRLGIEHPVLLAAMGFVSGGALAAAVSAAGGFGIIGGGYAAPRVAALAARRPPLDATLDTQSQPYKAHTSGQRDPRGWGYPFSSAHRSERGSLDRFGAAGSQQMFRAEHWAAFVAGRPIPSVLRLKIVFRRGLCRRLNTAAVRARCLMGWCDLMLLVHRKRD